MGSRLAQRIQDPKTTRLRFRARVDRVLPRRAQRAGLIRIGAHRTDLPSLGQGLTDGALNRRTEITVSTSVIKCHAFLKVLQHSAAMYLESCETCNRRLQYFSWTGRIPYRHNAL